jgi:hypothetical protein
MRSLPTTSPRAKLIQFY